MDEELLERLKERYKLPDAEHGKIGALIEDTFLEGKTPVQKPIAIFNFAPPGSGKTRLNGYSLLQHPNSVVINSDELKPFHPAKDEIAIKYPEYYTKITDQESNPWTDELFERAIKDGYNIIYEGTGRNRRVIDTMRAKMKGYRIIVRGMAVNELTCLISILERYIEQIQKRGWGRLVTVEHFYKAYDKMSETIEIMEQLGFVDGVEIYRRGERKGKPVMIYESKGEANRFPNARLAVIGGRIEDKKNAIEYYKSTIAQLEARDGENASPEEEALLGKIKALYEELINSQENPEQSTR